MNNLTLAVGMVAISSVGAYVILHNISRLGSAIVNKDKNKKLYEYTNKTDRLLLVIAIVAFILLTLLFKNIATSLMGVVIIVLVPYMITSEIEKKRKREITYQLTAAIRMFTRRLEATRSYRASLLTAAKGTTGNTSKILREAYFRISHGEDLEAVMKRMGEALGGYHGKMFSNYIVLASKRGEQVVPLLNSLISSAVIEQEEENFRQASVKADNGINILLLIVPVVEYFVLLNKIPEVEQLMFGTAAGALIFTLWLVNIVTWFITNHIISE